MLVLQISKLNRSFCENEVFQFFSKNKVANILISIYNFYKSEDILTRLIFIEDIKNDKKHSLNAQYYNHLFLLL